jgi:hypothetical protein
VEVLQKGKQEESSVVTGMPVVLVLLKAYLMFETAVLRSYPEFT